MNSYLRIRSAFFLAVSLLFSNLMYAQKAEDFIGDWKIIKVELSPNAEQEAKQFFSKLNAIFLKSTFHFKPNNSFSFDSPDEDLSIKDAVWQFDIKKQTIKVMERKSKGTPGLLMGIIVKETNGGYLFLMEETPVILTVVKKT